MRKNSHTEGNVEIKREEKYQDSLQIMNHKNTGEQHGIQIQHN